MLELQDPFARILGASSAAESIRAFGRRAAAVDATVLLTGESGTGKGLLARAIHDASRRARAQFIAINCAGVPAALFESEFFGHERGAFTGALHAHRGHLERAHQGTVFLDEIGELDVTLQAKLLCLFEDDHFLRVGGEKRVRADARYIAATNVNLVAAVQAHRFRQDLYYRLNVLTFRLPALRERLEDLSALADHYVDLCARRYGRNIRGVAAQTLLGLYGYSWPGNIRELAHVIEAAVLACDSERIESVHVPGTIEDPAPTLDGPAAPLRIARYSFRGSTAEECAAIRAALARFAGNRSRVAAVLGMSRNTLRARIRRCGL